MNALATVDQDRDAAHAIMERVITTGDLKLLTPEERSLYYGHVCRSVGLNPLTRPFEYLTLNGKLVLYARRECSDQLRKINAVSLKITSRSTVGDLFVVEVEAQDKGGRTDGDMGAVSVKGLQGEALANAMLKACTKAKRRVTLSICGLGFLDESELPDIPERQRQEWREPAARADGFDPMTGEVIELQPKPEAAKRSTIPVVYNGEVVEEHASIGAWWGALKRNWIASRTGTSNVDNLSVLRRLIAKLPEEDRGHAEKMLADMEEDAEAEPELPMGGDPAAGREMGRNMRAG